jgi:hypothetical protein
MKFSSKNNLEVGSIVGVKPDTLFFRCFPSIDGITSMEETLIVEYKDGNFSLNRIIEEECSSIKFFRNNQLWCLGTYGNIYILDQGKWHDKKIKIEPYRYLNSFWEINKQIYCAGTGRRVLKLYDFTWQTILPESAEEDTDLFCMDASPDGTIFIVGENGSIFKYRKDKFEKLEAPTNYDIFHILVEDVDKIFICGENGCLFVGTEENWTNYSQTEMDMDFYSIINWMDKYYISAENQVLEFDGREFTASENIGSFSLWDASGKLWSLGLNEIHFFDGKSWQEFEVEFEVELKPAKKKPKV